MGLNYAVRGWGIRSLIVEIGLCVLVTRGSLTYSHSDTEWVEDVDEEQDGSSIVFCGELVGDRGRERSSGRDRGRLVGWLDN